MSSGDGIVSRVYPYRYFLAITLLSLTAFVFRLVTISHNSIWADEEFTLHFSQRSYGDIFFGMVDGEFNPPLFFWLAHTMLALTGSTAEWVIRFPSVVAGALTIPLAYLLGRDTFPEGGRRAGLFLAVLMATSVIATFYSQEARAYAFVILFATLLLWAYMRLLRAPGERTWWVILGVASVLLIWTHFFTIVFLGAILAHGLLAHRGDAGRPVRKAVGKATLIGLWGGVPILVTIAGLFTYRVGAKIEFGYKGADLIRYTIEQFLGYNTILVIIGVYLVLFGLLYLIKERRDIFPLPIWLAVSSLGCAVLAATFFSFLPKYVIFLLPVLYLVMTAGVLGIPSFLPDRVRAVVTRDRVLAIATVLILVAGVWTLGYYATSFSKDDWRGFSASLTANTSRGDVIYIAAKEIVPTFTYYYNATEDGTTLIGLNLTQEEIAQTLMGVHPRGYLILHGLSIMPRDDLAVWAKSSLTYEGSWENIDLFSFASTRTSDYYPK